MALAVPPLTVASGWTWILPALRLARSPTVGVGSSAAGLAGSLAQPGAVTPAISTRPMIARRPGELTACLHHPAPLPAQVLSQAQALWSVQAPSQAQTPESARAARPEQQRDRKCRPARSAPALRTPPADPF